MSDAEPSGVRPGEGALKYSHSGYRYILGYGSNYFGIWDRERPGGPIARFPRTDDGWDEAWSKFVAWEPHAVDAKKAVPPDFTSAHARGRWTIGLLWFHVVVAVLGAVYFMAEIADLSGLDVLNSSSDLGEVRSQIEAVMATLFAIRLIPVPAAIAWLLWQYRAHHNLRPLGATDLRFTAAWAVAWWFIPIAFLFLPYLTIRELWNASDPHNTDYNWKRSRGTPLLRWWWAGWLGALVVYIVALALGESGDQPALIAESSGGIGFALSLALSAILSINVVRGIDARQERKHDRMAGNG